MDKCVWLGHRRWSWLRLKACFSTAGGEPGATGQLHAYCHWHSPLIAWEGDSVAASSMYLGVAGKFWPPLEVWPLTCAFFDDVSSLACDVVFVLTASPTASAPSVH
jgi:hypothetical protein